MNILWICDIDLINKNFHQNSSFEAGYKYQMNLIRSLSDKSNIFIIFNYKKNTFLNFKSGSQILNQTLGSILNNQSINFVMTYPLTFNNLIRALILKFKFQDLQTLFFIPDIPKFFDTGISNKPIKFALKYFEDILILKLINKIDFCVFFAESMVTYFKYRKKYVVIEGVQDLHSVPNYSLFTIEKNPLIFSYAGSLNYNMGIEQLINAFESFRHNRFILNIYGNGPLFKEKSQKIYKNVFFKGFHNGQYLDNLLFQSDILILYRNPSLSYTKYSFPSKLYFYLKFGKPILTSKLKGISNEYSNLFDFFDFNDNDSLISKIKSYSELNKYNSEVLRSKMAFEYVNNHKNSNVQTMKIITMIMDKN